MDRPHRPSLTRRAGPGASDRPPRGRGTVALVLALVAGLGAACGSYARPEAGPPTTTTTTTTTLRPGQTTTSTTAVPPSTAPGATTTPPTTAPRATELGALPGRLVVITPLGDLVTMAPNGTGRTQLATPANGVVSRPTWSPDGTRLSYTATRGDAAASVRVVAPDGSSGVEQALLPAATVHAWSPDGATIAVVHPTGANTAAVELLHAASPAAPVRGPSAATVQVSWEPGGSRLAVHAGDTVAIVTADGAARSLGIAAGGFGAPVWLPGNRLLVGVKAATGSVLAVIDPDSGARRDLLAYDGNLAMVADTAGNRVAVQLEPASGGAGDAQLVAWPGVRPQTPPGAPTTTAAPAPGNLARLAPQTLAVVDVAKGGAPETVVNQTTAAFAWSPGGERLAFLVPTSSSTGRWDLWDGTRTARGTEHQPSSAFIGQYLPAFDQYAQTSRLWSPDGKALVFTGVVGGQDGVWVQRVDATTPGAPVRVSDGALAFWSPK